MRDAIFFWYVGLDAEGTRIGDVLWKGDEIDEMMRSRVVGLFRLDFTGGDGDEPVYLILAMTPDNKLRMKPQNLLVGLPVERLELVS
jgi:hypothetical protein